MITGAAKVAGVVGWPVAHSLSPLIHNAWIDALGLDAAYVPFAVPPGELAALVQVAARGRWLTGLNVTLPHKPEALKLADSWTTTALFGGAANVLIFRSDGTVHAENFDGEGMLSALAQAQWRPDSGPALVLGGGGAARGALAALSEAGSRQIRIAARARGAAEELAELGLDQVWTDFRPYSFDQLDAALDGVTAVINATSAGLNGVGELPDMSAAPRDAVFMDMVYKPLRTPFLQAAAARGHSTIDGLAMLIGQARPSFQMFFGVPAPPPEVVDVRALCLRALGEAR